MPDDANEGVAEHRSRMQPSINLHAPVTAFYVQLLWYPIYYPGGMKARVSPVQWSKSYNILAPTRIRTRAAGFKIICGDHYTTTARVECITVSSPRHTHTYVHANTGWKAASQNKYLKMYHPVSNTCLSKDILCNILSVKETFIDRICMPLFSPPTL